LRDLRDEQWTVAKGGRSVNIGHHGKLRMEPGFSADQIAAVMRLVAAAPALRRLVFRALNNGAYSSVPGLTHEVQTLLVQIDGAGDDLT
jgi:hypothetical protein